MSITSPIEDRFWSKVDKSGGPDSCWLWTGAKHEFGYGMFNMGVKYNYVITTSHRVAYVLHHGLKLDDYTIYVCHDCPGGDVPACCNPSHLFLGDATANNRDTGNKGRRNDPCGEDRNTAKVNEETVRLIRRKYIKGVYGFKRIADELNLSHSLVHDIVRRKTWRHVV
jgi:hypothetical protein